MATFSRDEIKLIKKVREWAEYQSYDTRRNYFYRVLNEIGHNPTSHEVKFAYSISQNLVLDESDLIEIMSDFWGMSHDEIYRCVW